MGVLRPGPALKRYSSAPTLGFMRKRMKKHGDLRLAAGPAANDGLRAAGPVGPGEDLELLDAYSRAVVGVVEGRDPGTDPTPTLTPDVSPTFIVPRAVGKAHEQPYPSAARTARHKAAWRA